MKCNNCGHPMADGACTKCGSGAATPAPTDTAESVYADLRTVIGGEHWDKWRAELAEAAAQKRNPAPETTEEG